VQAGGGGPGDAPAVPALAIAACTAAAQAVEGASTPRAMMEKAVSAAPAAEVRPTVGRRPTTPHRPAGTRTDPPPSMPRAKAAMPAATDAADPDDDPPANRAVSCGLRAVPHTGFRPVMPTPASWQLAFPSRTAPAARSAATAGASAPATPPRCAARMADPAVVAYPAASTPSMTAKGTPSSGDSGAAAACRREDAAEARRTAAGSTEMKARRGGPPAPPPWSESAMAARAASAT
jgi:hypothetical protein